MSTSSLPPLYARWVDDLLGAPVPAEPHASCASCAMCEGGARSRPKGRITLQPKVKCCTYLPTLANFLVGGILENDAPNGAVGKASVQRRIAAGGVEVSPLGLSRPTGWQDPDPSTPSLGAACPHLDEGQCGIWENRHAVCATWWCKHERGASGQRAWTALRTLLLAVEGELALWCADQAGYPADGLQGLVAQGQLVAGLALEPNIARGSLWGPLVGQEEAFYRGCWARVRDLSWAEVAAICGPSVGALARHARAQWAHLDDPLPGNLKVGAHRVVSMGADGVLAETYSAFDPIFLPAILQSVLPMFDGTPTAAVLAELVEDRGLGFEEGYLQELVDFGILVGRPAPR